ncbi:hypothetical protein KOR42_14250 [Thalassoglobus neptunius]|uniref:DUF1570 domain-containing protein n=1 Tax=Thalassoglobus neptunius TaxID=1938619 RepID=A0A5C5X4X1_9PLAN|nr:DUF1570 domain-containing protein [Thalassoglobus neptunius]TWT58056.1 hypothetical protein KOR42_14250 [Thalassoglobus neptunius]
MLRASLLSFLFLIIWTLPALSDTITYRDEEGEEVTIEARIAGEGLGFQALERRDGQLQIVPNAAVTAREPTDPPPPIDEEGMVELFQKRFGTELVRTDIEKNFVVALILSSPIERSSESQASGFLRKASSFMRRVDATFLRYARSKRISVHEPRFPMVLLIFESDDDFNSYAEEATGGRGLSAENILGFYSPITNWLAVRMSSCDTFEVPLHEAIHLQMYNRVFQRLAPIPKWFDEGIATGFEGNGDRINISPSKVNSRYARQAMTRSGQLSWASVIRDDGAFTADILAGEAYTMAWCMHWMLATRHEDKYRDYVEELSQRKTLGEIDSDERIGRFEEIFDVSVDELQQSFPKSLQLAAKVQKIKLQQPRRDGIGTRTQSLGQVEMQAVATSNAGTAIEASGTLKNLSPLRTMTFYITMETSGGTYADWLIPSVAPSRSIQLPRQRAAKLFRPNIQLPPGSYQVFIRSVPADSRESQVWESGQVPGPRLGGD